MFDKLPPLGQHILANIHQRHDYYKQSHALNYPAKPARGSGPQKHLGQPKKRFDLLARSMHAVEARHFLVDVHCQVVPDVLQLAECKSNYQKNISHSREHSLEYISKRRVKPN